MTFVLLTLSILSNPVTAGAPLPPGAGAGLEQVALPNLYREANEKIAVRILYLKERIGDSDGNPEEAKAILRSEGFCLKDESEDGCYARFLRVAHLEKIQFKKSTLLNEESNRQLRKVGDAPYVLSEATRDGSMPEAQDQPRKAQQRLGDLRLPLQQLSGNVVSVSGGSPLVVTPAILAERAKQKISALEAQRAQWNEGTGDFAIRKEDFIKYKPSQDGSELSYELDRSCGKDLCFDEEAYQKAVAQYKNKFAQTPDVNTGALLQRQIDHEKQLRASGVVQTKTTSVEAQEKSLELYQRALGHLEGRAMARPSPKPAAGNMPVVSALASGGATGNGSKSAAPKDITAKAMQPTAQAYEKANQSQISAQNYSGKLPSAAGGGGTPGMSSSAHSDVANSASGSQSAERVPGSSATAAQEAAPTGLGASDHIYYYYSPADLDRELTAEIAPAKK